MLADAFRDEPDDFTVCQEFDVSEEVPDENADILFDTDPYLSIRIAFSQEVRNLICDD